MIILVLLVRTCWNYLWPEQCWWWEPEGGVSPVIIIICFTSTLSLSHYSIMCWVFGHRRFWIIQNMSLLNYPHWCSLLKTFTNVTRPPNSKPHPQLSAYFFCVSQCYWHLSSAPLCPRWEPPLTRDMGGECDNNSLVPITSGWHWDCGAMTDPTFEMVIGGALISEGAATCLCAQHQVIMVSW